MTMVCEREQSFEAIFQSVKVSSDQLMFAVLVCTPWWALNIAIERRTMLMAAIVICLTLRSKGMEPSSWRFIAMT